MTVPTPLPEPSQSPNWAAQLNAAITDRYEDAKQAAADVADTINTGRLSEDALKSTIATETGRIVPGKVAEAIAADDTVAQAAAAAAGPAVDAKVAALDVALRSDVVLDQIDFVELVRANTLPYRATLARTDTTTYEMRHHDGTRGVIYRFVKDTHDDFIKLDACFTGYSDSQEEARVITEADVSGTWNIGSSANWYTTEVGAGFTGRVRGAEIDLNLHMDSRGGLWSISIDGGTPFELSCWAESPTPSGQLHTIATGLDPEVEHTVVATFMGDDPDNPPSSTPSRGWIRNGGPALLIGSAAGGATPDTMILADASNKEMAFRIGGTWIPDHGVGTAFEITEPSLWVDGQHLAPGALAVGASTPVSDRFELRQHFHGRIDGVNLAEFHTTHTVTGAGVVNFSGRLHVLAPFTMQTAYPMMLPGYSATTDTFVSSILTRHQSPGDESETPFPAEGDASYSGAVISSSNPDVIGACTLIHPRLSYRRGGVSRPLFVWNRATKPKMYWQAMEACDLTPGDAYTWGCRYMVGEIEGVRGMLTT